MMKAIGIVMLAAPFVALFVLIANTSGIKVAMTIFGGEALVLVWILVGTYFCDR